MKEPRQNLQFSLVLTVIIAVPIFFAYEYFYKIPAMEQYIIENNCNDEEVICDFFNIDIYLLAIGLAVMFYLIYHKLEKQRIKNWKSFN